MASKIGIVIEREYTTRVMKKSFILMTLFAPLFFILLSALPGLLVAFGGEDEQVVAVDRPHRAIWRGPQVQRPLYLRHRRPTSRTL